MDESFREAQLEAIAREVAHLTRLILEGQAVPYDTAVQKQATALFVSLPNLPQTDTSPLLEAIEACLVNILSCDNAPWDTPEWAFREDLMRLETLLSEGEPPQGRV